MQGEEIDPKGIDASYLISDGWIDYEHDTDKVIGVPTKKTHVDRKGLFLQAKLFKDMPEVQSVMKLYHDIKDNHVDRKLGFSIEGNVIERDADDDSIIRQVQITGCAITHNPANKQATWELLTKSLLSPKKLTDQDNVQTDKSLLTFGVKVNKAKKLGDSFHSSTYCYSFDDPTGEHSGHSLKQEEKQPIKDTTSVEIGGKKKKSMPKSKDQASKALEAGYGISPSTQANGAAFRTEQLSDNLISLAQNLKQAKEIGLTSVGQTVAQILDKKGANDDVLTAFLQLFEGVSRNEAQAIVHAINTKTMTNSRLARIFSDDVDAEDPANDDDDDDDD